MKSSWQKIISNYNNTNKLTIDHILDTINSKRKELNGMLELFPKNENIFKCFEFCNIKDIKVVIIGQDPYHGLDQATGLSFAVNNGTAIPPSLRNIIKELATDLNINLTDTSLEHWAKQGVLMLNASLSVIQGKPASQMKLWGEFTDYIISELNKQEFIVFVIWGAFAHNKISMVDLSRHKVLISSHPSPLSCNKAYKIYPPFNGSRPFSKTNKLLKERNITEIMW